MPPALSAISATPAAPNPALVAHAVAASLLAFFIVNLVAIPVKPPINAGINSCIPSLYKISPKNSVGCSANAPPIISKVPQRASFMLGVLGSSTPRLLISSSIRFTLAFHSGVLALMANCMVSLDHCANLVFSTYSGSAPNTANTPLICCPHSPYASSRNAPNVV